MEFLEAMKQTGMDLDRTLCRFSGKAALLERFIKKFPADESFRELERAVDAGDHAEAQKCAHTLKGTAVNLGFDRLGASSGELVALIRSGRINEIVAAFAEVEREYKKIVHLIAQID